MDLRYPIGRFERPAAITAEARAAFIAAIASAPAELREAVRGLDDARLDTPYRPDGWTVRQLVHHVPDSHLNAYIRTKLALTEDEPTIKPYDEAAWAALDDSRATPIDVSLTLFEKLHVRWVNLLRSTPESAFAKTWRHPEYGVRTLDWLVGLYAWHGRHHTAHITSLRERNGW